MENKLINVDGHPPINTGKIGVLLVNLGTPDKCDTASVRHYLAEFLSDQRVIEMTPLLWQPILHGIILRTRPSKVAKAYQKIWLKEPAESPLMRHTREPAEKLQEYYDAHTNKDHPEVIVDWAMRYGNPAIEVVLKSLQQKGCDRILVCPLYPQYSATTTATVVDKVNDILKTIRWQPTIRVMPPYYAQASYIKAISLSIEAHLDDPKLVREQKPEHILLSFHGLPKEYFDKGDPYYCHCAKTAKLIQEKLVHRNIKIEMVFQSRFGPKQWLQPYATEIIKERAQQGVKNMAVIAPGFSADCLETIEEMGMENKEVFIRNGGQHYQMIDCLNASETALEMYQSLINNELLGWI